MEHEHFVGDLILVDGFRWAMSLKGERNKMSQNLGSSVETGRTSGISDVCIIIAIRNTYH